MQERRPALGGKALGGRADDLRPDREMAEKPPLLADLEVRSVGELADLADVVQQRGGHQQIRVQAGVELADVADQGPDRDRVLEQPAEIRVVTGAAARGSAEFTRHRLGEEDSLHHLAQPLVVNLPRQMLEEALQLVAVPVRAR